MIFLRMEILLVALALQAMNTIILVRSRRWLLLNNLALPFDPNSVTLTPSSCPD